MIDVKVRIHDKFSVELKIGYQVTHKQEPNDFTVNMWLFVPNSLDINAQTYSKGQFYRDLKSNVRLITPVFLLREIVSGQAIPYANMKRSFEALACDPTEEAFTDYEYEIKMFMAILKSSCRDEVYHILDSGQGGDMEHLCGQYLDNVLRITDAYRELRRVVDVHTVPSGIFNYYTFGDEFMSTTVEYHTFRLIRGLEKRPDSVCTAQIPRLKEMIAREAEYRRQQGYPVTDIESPIRNRDVIFRQGVLKRYIESDLFLSARVKRDGIAMEQFYFSIAAGISMIFATIVAFSFQQRYGNFTMPLFVALVVGYMLKDRIKELMRYWFAHKLKAKYFDNKITVSIKNEPIGWIKEGMDFITDAKVPQRVMEIRSRSPLVQAENRFDDEKIILFRRMVQLESELLKEEDRYSIAGINDIIRLHLTSFVQKMDNPEVPLYTVSESGDIRAVMGDKIYYLNMVLQFQHESQLEYRRYRIVLNRNGIMDIEFIN